METNFESESLISEDKIWQKQTSVSSIGLFYVPALKCSHNKKSVKSEGIFFPKKINSAKNSRQRDVSVLKDFITSRQKL